MRALSATILSALVAACAATRALPYADAPTLPSTCRRAVHLYATADRVGVPYQLIALLKAEGNFGGDSTLLRSLQAKAAALGANGLIYQPVDLGAQTAEGTAIWIPTDTTRVSAECTDADRQAAAADTGTKVFVRSPGMP